MSDTPAYISYVFVWHCLSDACPKCQRLNGREWRDQDLFQNTLWDPFEGNVWDLDADQTLAHPNCRCQLEVRADADERQFIQSEGEEFLELFYPSFRGGTDVTDIANLRQQIRDVRGETRELKASLSEVTYVILQFNRAARLAGLPPEISQGISLLLRLKLAAQAAYASIMLVYKGTGPIGWTLAALSLVSSAIVVYDTMTMEATY